MSGNVQNKAHVRTLFIDWCQNHPTFHAAHSSEGEESPFQTMFSALSTTLRLCLPKVHFGLSWLCVCGVLLATVVGDWLRQGSLRDWVCLLQPASFIYISLLSLSVMSSYNPLLARDSFYLFTGWSEFPANLQNCVFFIWSSIHCLTWETLANTELSPHVAPTPSPQLITPTSVCWPPCLYVKGPPLSPWQH